MRLRIVVGLGIFALVALGTMWYFGVSRSSAPAARHPIKSARTDLRPDNQNDKDELRWGNTEPAAFGQWLAASVPVERSDLASADRSGFATDVQTWLTAYADPSVARMRSLMTDVGIELPRSWTSEEAAQESWTESLYQLRQVTLDLSRTSLRRVRLNEFPPSGSDQERSRSCGERHGARPFMAKAQVQDLRTYEVVYVGTVQGESDAEPVQVRVGFTFAWDATDQRWVIVRVCLYDFPLSVKGYGPIL